MFSNKLCVSQRGVPHQTYAEGGVSAVVARLQVHHQRFRRDEHPPVEGRGLGKTGQGEQCKVLCQPHLFSADVSFAPKLQLFQLIFFNLLTWQCHEFSKFGGTDQSTASQAMLFDSSSLLSCHGVDS